MFVHLSPQRRSTDAELFEAGLPDMVEVVRFAPQCGRGPALVVSRRKMSGALLAQLRRAADATDDA